MPQKEKTAYLVGEGLLQNLQLIQALKELQLEPIPLEDPANLNILAGVDLSSVIIVFDEFAGPLFDSLRRSNKVKIYGVPAIVETLKQTREKRLPIIHNTYPLYCHHLRNCKVAVTGMRTKEQLHELRRFILYMDGVFMEKESPLTHLVADKVRGDKYRVAVALGKPILTPEWLEFLWRERNQSMDLKANLEELFKVKAFHKCNIAFEGFEESEKASMVKLVEVNGGKLVEPDDPNTTHIVKAMMTIPTPSSSCASPMCTPPVRTRTPDQLENDDDLKSPKKKPRFELCVINDLDEVCSESAKKRDWQGERAKIMKAEWFWSSIQIDACAVETDYLFYDPVKSLDELGNASIGIYGNSFTSPISYPLSDTDGGTPNSTGGTPQSIGRRKRKRQQNILSALAANECPRFITDIPEDVETANLGGSSLDQTPQDITDAQFATLLKDVTEYLNNADYKSMSGRQKEFSHLVETERNYVGILKSIVTDFKEPCENENQVGGRLLDPVEVKTIFGNVLPIYALHRQLLRDLISLQTNWTEESLIGKVFCDHSKGFRKAYEPFVNFFETIKAEITRCETEKSRFLAFVRIAQARPGSGKQSIADLMIRPIQRLPSTALILTNLKKHTKDSNPDYSWICQALEEMNGVNKGINEEKRITEQRIAMFDLYKEIEGFPAHLISAQRSLVARLDCLSMNNLFGQKFDPITVLVFNDHIGLAKRRGHPRGGSKMGGGVPIGSVTNLRSPALHRRSMAPTNSYESNNSKFRFKFVEKIEFENLKRVVHVTDIPGIAFSLIVRNKSDIRERILVFSVLEDPMKKWTKESIVTTIAQQVAGYLQRLDYSTLIATADSTQLLNNKLPPPHDGATVLEKASKLAGQARKKVSRALSLSRTPTNKLKRTVSQMMSPFTTGKRLLDDDSISNSDFDTTSCSTTTTPLRQNFSTVSLWGWGSKRESTPKPRPALSDKSETNSIFESIEDIDET